MIKNIIYIDDIDGEIQNSPLADPFDVSARQIAEAIGKAEGISVEEAGLLKKWLSDYIEYNLLNEEVQL